jgi:hypothetical protein
MRRGAADRGEYREATRVSKLELLMKKSLAAWPSVAVTAPTAPQGEFDACLLLSLSSRYRWLRPIAAL